MDGILFQGDEGITNQSLSQDKDKGRIHRWCENWAKKMSCTIEQGAGEFCEERWLFQRARTQVEMHGAGNE